jgi:hypothetical protein
MRFRLISSWFSGFTTSDRNRPPSTPPNSSYPESLLRTLGRWRSAAVAGPGQLGDASGEWIASSTISPTSSGSHSRLFDCASRDVRVALRVLGEALGQRECLVTGEAWNSVAYHAGSAGRQAPGCSCFSNGDMYSVSSTGPNGCRAMTSATTAGRDATPGPMSGGACAVLDRRSASGQPQPIRRAGSI